MVVHLLVVPRDLLLVNVLEPVLVDEVPQHGLHVLKAPLEHLYIEHGVPPEVHAAEHVCRGQQQLRAAALVYLPVVSVPRDHALATVLQAVVGR